MARTQKTQIGKITVSPGDVTPIGLDWGPWLAATADTIYDNPVTDKTAPGLEIQDSWFSDTYTHLLVGPIPRGTFKANFDIDTEAGEHYHRELQIRCR